MQPLAERFFTACLFLQAIALTCTGAGVQTSFPLRDLIRFEAPENSAGYFILQESTVLTDFLSSKPGRDVNFLLRAAFGPLSGKTVTFVTAGLNLSRLAFSDLQPAASEQVFCKNDKVGEILIFFSPASGTKS